MFEDKILGVDIGSKNMRMALVATGKKPQIIKWATCPTPQGSVLDGEIRDIEAVGSLLKKTAAENGLKSRKMSICLNSNHAVVRELRLPVLKDTEMTPAVEYELSQTYPGITQTHSISFKIYSKDENGMTGIVTFCPNKIVEGYMKVAQTAGIPLKYLDIHPNCTAKAYNAFSRPTAGEASLLVNIGALNSNVSILADGKLIISRSVSSGGASVDNMIASHYGITAEKAEEDKLQGYKGYEMSREELDTYIRLGYAAVEDQMRQTMDFYRFNKYKAPITTIRLAGGGSLFKGMDRYFQEVFRLPVSVIKPDDGLKLPGDDFLLYMPAIGAALRED